VCTRLTGIDPDEALSRIPYEKGYFFLRALEEAAGREAFSRWLRSYLTAFRFASITTDDFTAHLERELPGVLEQVEGPRWIDRSGVPETAPRPRSARLEAIEQLGGALPDPEVARAWSPTEWQLYLESVPRPAPAAMCEALGERFRLTESTNYEVLVSWLVLALSSGYHRVVPRAEEVLGAVGRMKFLRPLYLALAADERTRPIAPAAQADGAGGRRRRRVAQTASRSAETGAEAEAEAEVEVEVEVEMPPGGHGVARGPASQSSWPPSQQVTPTLEGSTSARTLMLTETYAPPRSGWSPRAKQWTPHVLQK
jgi:hypothetical protein